MYFRHLSLSIPRALLSLMLAGAGTFAAASGDTQAPDPRIARGEAVLTALNNGKTQPVFEAMRRDFPFLADATAGYALGDVWGRQGLDVRTRQLAAMAAFGALGLRPFFKVHAGYALNAGVSPEELKEIVYLITVPAGFPRAIEASQTLHELFVERGIVVKPVGR
ncbi:carboxymuconolactone decarboxylase family protein [Paucibacter sp. M5-1]|uniref:carboxymuconolactone decarboxylase family protein n=1 Tax=Paucibacter sp. M5-1 TaxID=3015998 RepID=UPI0022B881F2|nr:carboxymuconolactone decarboxylase family protein [Paucibacter sp. M5-1]MCZ7880423.1 carboxymuconolactone decarboxylase family protein [Paucibacter sp. M5-1]